MDNTEFPMTRLENMNPELYEAAMKLYKAAMKGDMNLLTSILEVDCPPDRPPDLTLCHTPQKNTALHIAVEYEQQDIVKRMINQWPSLISQPNCKGDTPLHVAARVGHLDLIKLLTPALNSNLTERNPALEEGNPTPEEGNSTLEEGSPTLEEGNLVRQAAYHGSLALRTSNSEGSNPIHEALKKSHGEVALHLLEFEGQPHELAREVNMAGESLLYLAAEAGLERVVQKIIDTRIYSTRGPDGQNPLHIAVIKDELGVVKILLDNESNFIARADRFGNTVLHYASAQSYRRVREGKDKVFSQKQILQLLLKANPYLAYVPNRNGDYPLFFAIRKGSNFAVDTILDHCPDSAELVNQKGQNALHLAIMGKNQYIISWLARRLEFKKLINEPDNDGNTPMHLATRTDQHKIVQLLIRRGPPDLTMSNKQGLTAMDICGYTATEHPIRDRLRGSGAVPGRHQWQQQFPIPSGIKTVKINQEFKTLGLQTLPIVTSLVATVTFAAAFTVPGGYKNDGPREGLPVFMRNQTLQAFMLSDILAFCSSMAATVLLVYANANSEDAFKVFYALQACYYISGVAIFATITAFVTAVCVLTSKENESAWLAVTSFLLGCAIPLFLFWYRTWLKEKEWDNNVKFLFSRKRDGV